MSNIWYTPFVCMCLYCVSWWCCSGTGHLIGPWSLTAQGLYVGLVGWCDIHCKFLSTFMGCVLPNESMCINCTLRMEAYWTYDSMKLCIVLFLNGILSVSYFVLRFVYRFHYILESVYWFHSKPPCIHACLVLCLIICQVRSHSELSVIFDQCFV